MKKLQRSGQAHFIRASSPDSAPPNPLFAARACAPKCEPARRLSEKQYTVFLEFCQHVFNSKHLEGC